MKTIAIDGFGGPDVLRKRGLPRPEPRDDELRIRVVVAGVSTLDVAARAGTLVDDSFAFPWIPGFEVAGTVDALGPRCSRFRQGDRVWAQLPGGGGYAEYAVTRECFAAPMPAALLFEEAACVPLDGVTAWNGLFAEPSPLDDSATAWILGASGGAGHLALQLALAAGARVVVRAPQDHRDFVNGLGTVEWADEHAAPGDLLGELREADRAVIEEPTTAARVRSTGIAPRIVDLSGAHGSAQDASRGDEPLRTLSVLSTLVAKRRFRPRLSKILNIACAAEAHERIETGNVCGKLALAF